MSCRQRLAKNTTLQESSYVRPNHVCLLNIANRHRLRGYYNDVTIRVGGHDIEANRMVLGCFSNYFHKRFTSDVRDVINNVVNVNDVDEECMKALIDYIYTERLVLNRGNVCEIFAAAELLEIEAAKAHCVQFLKESITIATYLDVRTIAELYSSSELLDAVRDFISTNSIQVINGTAFMTMTKQELIACMRQRNKEVVTAKEVYAKVIEWVKYDHPNREEQLKDVLEYVEMQRLPTDFLEDVVYEEPLIRSNKECFEIYVTALRNQLRIARRASRRSCEFLVFGAKGFSNCVHSYDITDRLWKAYPNCITARYNATVAVANNFAYLIGGQVETRGSFPATNSVESLNLIGDQTALRWQTLQSMQTKRFCCGCAVANDNIIVVGGADQNAIFLRSCEEFDPSRGQWRQVADMGETRSAHAVIASHGCVYAIGGHDRMKTLSSAERFDWRHGKWHHISPMKSTRRWLTAATLNGDIYAIGGDLKGDKSMPTNTVEKFESRMNSWTPAQNMAQSRRGCGACALDNKIYVVGGANRNKFHSTIEAYDPTNDRWQIEFDTSMEMLYPSVASLQ